MDLKVEPSSLRGEVLIPASKSHTIRAVVMASLAEGKSILSNPLVSADTLSAVDTCRALGAQVVTEEGFWRVQGTGGRIKTPEDIINVGNSGTTLYIAMPMAALNAEYTFFTGDGQIRNRPAQPLLTAINELGGTGVSSRGNGKPPLFIKGRIKGGRVALDGSKTSQYLTALLINCPLAARDTEILVKNAVEKPYIEMTLSWLDRLGIKYKREGFENFLINGGQCYRSFEREIPGDFSSATFFLCAAAITGSELLLRGLDMGDTQGDKAVVSMLKSMGVQVSEEKDALRITGGELTGGDFDLGDTPDALPAMAVTACFARGTTRFYNVSQARLKETDRIRVMKETLTMMGAQIEEKPDGLIIKQSRLHGARLPGHMDHRVVMALALAGLNAEGETVVDSAEAAGVTFPNFVPLMRQIGAKMKVVD